ncbi:MAG: flagellar export chaperone FliS, partial [Alphaproteobacteria bacterium]|nr:flagellar export chaperone FliS [Alphaproteobacteria bacterium]
SMTQQNYIQGKVQAYSNQQILSASPARIVYLLYDRAIFWLKDAILAIEANEIERRWKACCKARDIIEHFLTTLNFEEGGEISVNLEKIFTCCLHRLPDVDIKNDAKAAQDVINLLEPLRNSWREVADQADRADSERLSKANGLPTSGAVVAPSSSHQGNLVISA